MYNRLFTKILDSSIWLEPVCTRVVWITLLAAMDEDGICRFACPANLARRAGVTLKECEKALDCLMSPDPNSSDPEFDGRRLERFDGGYIVLNAKKYRELFSRQIQREQTRLRVQRYREKKAGNAHVTASNERVTQSDAVSETEAEERKNPQAGDIFASDEWKDYEQLVLDTPDGKKWLPKGKGFYRKMVEKHGLEEATDLLVKCVEVGNRHLIDPEKA